MKGLTVYKAEAIINGPVLITPRALSMRHNDEQTPHLDVWVSYITADDKKRPFVLTDYKILFEAITPGGGYLVLSSDESSCFEIINHSQGHFLFTFPPECKDAVGSSKLAYFRFVQGEYIYSAGNFSYTVEKDIYSVPASVVRTPTNFNQDLKKLQDEFSDVKTFATDANAKAGTALAAALRAEDEAKNKQNKAPDAVDGNVAAWESGSTKDSGVKASDIKEALNTLSSLGACGIELSYAPVPAVGVKLHMKVLKAVPNWRTPVYDAPEPENAFLLTDSGESFPAAAQLDNGEMVELFIIKEDSGV